MSFSSNFSNQIYSEHGFWNTLSLARALGYQDIKENYKRSLIGPFWFTIAMAVQIGAIGVIFGLLFGQNLQTYLPFLATGIIAWTFISSTINESANVLIVSESMVKQIPLPPYLYVLRVLWKNLLILGHNLIVIPVLFIILGFEFKMEMFLFVPGMVLVALNLAWFGTLLSFIGVRFRDTPPMVSALLSIAFYATPIMWSTDQLPQGVITEVVQLNPFFQLIDLIRNPLLGVSPSVQSWAISIGAVFIGWFGTHLVAKRISKLVPFWV